MTTNPTLPPALRTFLILLKCIPRSCEIKYLVLNAMKCLFLDEPQWLPECIFLRLLHANGSHQTWGFCLAYWEPKLHLPPHPPPVPLTEVQRTSENSPSHQGKSHKISEALQTTRGLNIKAFKRQTIPHMNHTEHEKHKKLLWKNSTKWYHQAVWLLYAAIFLLGSGVNEPTRGISLHLKLGFWRVPPDGFMKQLTWEQNQDLPIRRRGSLHLVEEENPDRKT